MNTALAAPRTELSPVRARASRRIQIDPDKIGLLIGPGGKTIKGIVAETGAEINIDDDGTRPHLLEQSARRWCAPSRSSKA